MTLVVRMNKIGMLHVDEGRSPYFHKEVSSVPYGTVIADSTENHSEQSFHQRNHTDEYTFFCLDATNNAIYDFHETGYLQ